MVQFTGIHKERDLFLIDPYNKEYSMPKWIKVAHGSGASNISTYEFVATLPSSVSIVFNGVSTLDTVINAWNAANSDNTVGYTGGVGSIVPSAQTVNLTVGSGTISYDANPDCLKGFGRFIINGDGVFVLNSYLPVFINAGLGGYVAYKRGVADSNTSSFGIQGYDANKVATSCRNFIVNNDTSTLAWEYKERECLGEGGEDYQLPPNTRFIRILARSSGGSLIFDGLNITTKNFAKTISNTIVVGALDFDWSAKGPFYKALSANSVITFSNETDGQSVLIKISNTSAGDITLTLPTLQWENNIALTTVKANKSNLYTFNKVNGIIFASTIEDYITDEYTTKLNFISNGVYTSIAGNASASATNYTLPPNAGSADQLLSTNGTGTLSWVAVLPAGAVASFAMNSIPAGWLKANGAAISRTTYAALYAAIGTVFGAGDGSLDPEGNPSTFNIPDLRGEFIRGWDDGRGIDSGRTFGSAQTDEFRSHNHNFPENFGWAGNYMTGGTNNPSPSGNFYTSYSGGVETRPRNIALLACIKY